jgi:Tfp pilus assembly protein PilF
VACSGSAGHAAAPATPLAARPAAPEPRRPKLPRDEDTCEASAYYQYGLSQLRLHPDLAAAAFYWSQRLLPATAVAYYAQRIALLMADRNLLRGYVEGDRVTLRSEEVHRIDSLQVRAMSLDPFFPRRLDEDLIVAYFTDQVRNELLQQGEEVSDAAIEFYVRHDLQSADAATRAWLAFARGDYRQAADLWAGELRHDPKDTDLRAQRSQALFLLGKLDSARAELVTALAAARRSDAETMKYVYDSKAVWEYELGRIGELQGKDSVAREAYQQSLVEDLSFYPARRRLADLALRARDTATAVTELQRAIEIKEDDFTARLELGVVQAAQRSFGSATEHLRRVTEIEPWAAYPHFLLANVRMDAGDREGAAPEYRRFLALASPTDPAAGAARRKLEGLSASRP